MGSHLTAAQQNLLRRALVNNPQRRALVDTLQRLDQSQSDHLGGLDRAGHAH